VLNGDVLSDFDLGALVAFHHETGAEATIQLTPVPDPSAFGVVPTDESGRVTAFIEKPPAGQAPTNLVNAGCYVLEPSVLRRVETGRRVSIERETFPALVADGTLFAMSSDAYWLDTGTPQKFIDASLDVLHGRRTELSRPRAEEVTKGVFVGAHALTDGAVESPAYLGPGSKVAKGSVVSDSVIGASVEIDHGAVISGSIIMEGAVIGEGARIESSIVGPSASVGAGAKVTGCSVIRGRSRVAPGSQLASARHPSA
jgi:NDP-sugar pyrophosphorylase family protein